MNPWTAPGASPEERARECTFLWSSIDEIEQRITAAIRAAKMDGYRENIAQTEEAIKIAVAEERERCIHIIREAGKREVFAGGRNESHLRAIDAIRTRTDKEGT